MALKVYHNRADHTHENEQFRRIALNLIEFFKKQNWDGILIGNPENSDFQRFRADALLYYNNGAVIIDLKNYDGNISLPSGLRDFEICKWYNEVTDDRVRIEIKGGSKFANPFAQLKSYRTSFYEIVNSNILLNSKVNTGLTAALNIFRGPISLNRKTPAEIPYYRIVDEENLLQFIYDFAGFNKFQKEAYSNDVAVEFLRIFESEEWTAEFEYKKKFRSSSPIKELSGDVKDAIEKFFKSDNDRVLIMTSPDTEERDNWMKNILNSALDYGIPQTEVWAHSTRVARRIQKRSGILPLSLFNAIYGGSETLKIESSDSDNEDDVTDNEHQQDIIGLKSEKELDDKAAITLTIDSSDSDKEDDATDNEHQQDIIGLRSDKDLDEKAAIILHEGHLVTRTLFQTDLLKFGTGRLLEDFLAHVSLSESKRKVIVIGDPYSLSYGKEEESAIDAENMQELIPDGVVVFKSTDTLTDDTTAIRRIKDELCASIGNNQFSSLRFSWDSTTVSEIDKPKSMELFRKWFSKPSESEPEFAALVYSNRDAATICQWIRKNVQGKTEDFAKGDILLVCNNFYIPDELGMAYPQKISNGMYLLVEENIDSLKKPIPLRGAPQATILKFRKLRVKCLSIENKPSASIWILENFFDNNKDLSFEERLAFRYFVSSRVDEFNKGKSFESSPEYIQLIQSPEYNEAKENVEVLKRKLEQGERVKTKIPPAERKLKKITDKAIASFKQSGFLHVRGSDPMVNAALVQYAYALTVHKALGSNFKEVVFNVNQGLDRGVKNEDYFRWLFTGLSCVTEKVNIINPISIHPMMDTVFHDTEAAVAGMTNEEGKKVEITFDKAVIPSDFRNKMDSQIPENIQQGIYVFSTQFLTKGALFNKTTFVKYGIKAYYSIDSSITGERDNLILIFSYNKNELLTKIAIQQPGKFVSQDVADCINNLYDKFRNSVSETELPDDFRKPFFQTWIDKAAALDIKLVVTDVKDYEAQFTATANSSFIKLKCHNTGDGFISHVYVLEKSDDEISETIKNIIMP